MPSERGSSTRVGKKLAVAGLVLIVLAAAWLSLYFIPAQVVYAPRYPITRTPAEVGLAYEDVSFRPADADIRLAAWWMPAPEPRATLVFVHGGSSNRHTPFFRALEFYAAMVERGVSVLAMDLRNHGDSESTAEGIRFGAGEWPDLTAAITWAKRRAVAEPLVAMGISMGGGVAIFAAREEDRLDGIILCDPLLDTASAFAHSVEVVSGLPAAWLRPSAWSAIRFFGLPGRGERALDVGAGLELPILLIQDPDDPVTRAEHARALAAANANVSLWMAPPVDRDHPDLGFKEDWGSHVAAFTFFPDEVLSRILAFIARLPAR